MTKLFASIGSIAFAASAIGQPMADTILMSTFHADQFVAYSPTLPVTHYNRAGTAKLTAYINSQSEGELIWDYVDILGIRNQYAIYRDAIEYCSVELTYTDYVNGEAIQKTVTGEISNGSIYIKNGIADEFLLQLVGMQSPATAFSDIDGQFSMYISNFSYLAAPIVDTGVNPPLVIAPDVLENVDLSDALDAITGLTDIPNIDSTLSLSQIGTDLGDDYISTIRYRAMDSLEDINTVSIASPDINNDGILDSTDIVLFIQFFIASDPRADIASPSGVYDATDLTTFVTNFLNPQP